MAKPSRTESKNVKPVAKAVARTEIRNTPIPKAVPRSAVPRVVTYDMIAVRAYEIHASGQGGSEFDNWIRAEREIRTL